MNPNEYFDAPSEEEVPHRDLGAYVVGGLDDDERVAFERTLAGDTRLQTEVAELSALPDLLALAALVDGDGIDDVKVARRSNTRPALRSRTPATFRTPWFTAVAASIALVLGIAGGVVATRDRAPAPARSVAFSAVDGGSTVGADGRADLFGRSDGVAVRLRLRGLEPTDASSRYECWWVGANGRVAAGSFEVGADGTADVRLNVAGSLEGSFRININRVANGNETRVLTAKVD